MDQQEWRGEDQNASPVHAVTNSGQLFGRHVFLSASFPSGKRAVAVSPFDAAGIADAVSAVVRAVLSNGGKLLFGGHPTISPLVLMIAQELQVQDAVDIFQSEFFKKEVPEETDLLQSCGFGKIYWTENLQYRASSLDRMRRTMLGEFANNLAGSVFVGGMDGITDEYNLVGEFRIPRIPISGPGGAAAKLTKDTKDECILGHLKDYIHTKHYPFLASLIVEKLSAIISEDLDRLRF